MKYIYNILVIVCLSFSIQAKTGICVNEKPLKITVKVKNYSNDTLQIGYYFGDKQYLVPDKKTESDILIKQPNGTFVFNTTDALEPGIYFILFKPDNNYIDFIVPQNLNRGMDITLDFNALQKSISVQGDDNENKYLYEHLNYLNTKRELSETLTKNEDREGLNRLSQEVEKFQFDFIKKYSNTIAAAVVRSNINIKTPDYEGYKEEVRYKTWKYYKKHYFDNLDLKNPALLRTPFLYNKINYYVKKLTVQHPDSISKSIDLILNKMKPAENTFKYYVIHFLNTYAKSKFIGMDSVYVHMVDNYYANGLAYWTDKQQLETIIRNANDLKPILVGKVAPNLKLEQKNGIQFNLHDLNSKYIVLFFYQEGCTYCKNAGEQFKTDFEKLAALDVDIVSISVIPSTTELWDYVDSNFLNQWINASITSETDPDFIKYKVERIPELFVLDKNKRIISKKLSSQQVLELMQEIGQTKE